MWAQHRVILTDLKQDKNNDAELYFDIVASDGGLPWSGRHQRVRTPSLR